MKFKSFHTLIFFLGINLYTQELPPIQSFTPQEYHGENQNWGISQSSSKFIYVANNKGLLEFNGARWQLYPSPNESILRSVRVVGQRIYTGCFMEFGYWQRNKYGSLDYTSLSRKIDAPLIEDEEFWKILVLDDLIVFQSLKRIYIYNINDGSVNIIDSSTTITKMFKVGETIYFQRKGQGVFKIDYGKAYLVFDDSPFKNDEIINIFQKNQELLVLTQNDGFYIFKDGLLVKSDFTSNDYLSNFSFYDAIQLKDNRFVLGTISNGVIYLNENGEYQYQIDQDKGLANNTVLSLFEDTENNIWLGLDNGISYVNTNAPYKVYTDHKGTLGSIYTAAVYGDNLYLGTNQGLFYKKLGIFDDFKFVKGTQGQVWSLREIDKTLFCGHNSGTFAIKGDEATKISNVQGTWDISKLDRNPEILLQGNYDGLYILKKTYDSWKLRNKIEGFNNSSRYFESLGNKIFVNHEYNGVFELEVDAAFDQAKSVRIDTTIKGANSGIIKYKDDLLYAYKKGIYKYQTQENQFVKDTFFSQIYTEDEYESGKLILTNKEDMLWVFTQPNISFVSRDQLTNSPKIKQVPLTKDMRRGILGYENITRLHDSRYLIGTTSGYIVFDIDKLEIDDFDVHIGHVANMDYRSEEVSLDKEIKGYFNPGDNNVKISYFAPEYYKFLIPEYTFQLLGIYDNWSDWSEKHTVTFENLPHGEYSFNVKGKIGNTFSTNIASYSFKIAKPWYISDAMIAFYAIGVVLFYLTMHSIYKRYYKQQQEKLILKNKQELELAKVQNEKEIIKFKNERLEVEFKSKSKELAASTMNIVKKNELLTSIKDELNKIKSKELVKPVIKIIDKSLNLNDDWELFQEAFNNADSEFLKKVKTLHPSLTPNDLRLCAYLRLNLSSKEIAPLLNISVRSVEVKRYRLRKKMALPHENSLVEYILNL